MNKETKTGYIYSLTCSNPNLIYYGSTTKKLNDRLTCHKYDFKNNNCVSSKILFEWGNVKINMIEEIEYENKQELLERESYYIRNLKCINKIIPYKTKEELKSSKKEYYCDNRKKILTHRKEYYEKNKDIINKKNKDYYEKNKEKKKQYYSDNKEKIKEYKKIKITCECGSKIIKNKYNTHKKSQKHKVYEFLKEIEESNIKL